MKLLVSLLLGLILPLMSIGCEEPMDTADGGDARQARKAEINGGSPEEPFPGQFATDPNAAAGAATGGDPDR